MYLMGDNLYILDFENLKMKKLKIILFTIILFLVLDNFLGIILNYYYLKIETGPIGKTNYIINSTNEELLFIGASSTTHHYIPEVFEKELKLSCYNAGQDGTGLAYYYALIKMILVRYTPKIIILDIAQGILNKNYDDYARLSPLLPYYKDHKEMRPIIIKRSKFEKIKLLLNTYPYNSLIAQIIWKNLNQGDNKLLNSQGFSLLSGKLNLKTLKNKKKINIEVDPAKVNTILEIIKITEKNDIKLIIVSPPSYIDKYEYAKNRIQNISYLQGIDFIDFENDSTFTGKEELFHDFNHLNHEGAYQFSVIAANKIKNLLENKHHIN